MVALGLELGLLQGHAKYAECLAAQVSGLQLCHLWLSYNRLIEGHAVSRVAPLSHVWLRCGPDRSQTENAFHPDRERSRQNTWILDRERSRQNTFHLDRERSRHLARVTQTEYVDQTGHVNLEYKRASIEQRPSFYSNHVSAIVRKLYSEKAFILESAD
jgi:hypothetical protein